MPSTDHRLWRPDRSPRASQQGQGRAGEEIAPSWACALKRGVSGRCPVCGQARLFDGYLSVVNRCAVCGATLGSVPADDAPAWITMLIALHLLVGLVVLVEQTTSFDTATTVLIMLPAAFLLCMALLRPVKGSIIAVLLKLEIRREDQEPT